MSIHCSKLLFTFSTHFENFKHLKINFFDQKNNQKHKWHLLDPKITKNLVQFDFHWFILFETHKLAWIRNFFLSSLLFDWHLFIYLQNLLFFNKLFLQKKNYSFCAFKILSNYQIICISKRKVKTTKGLFQSINQ